jgi:hypothetical protein
MTRASGAIAAFSSDIRSRRPRNAYINTLADGRDGQRVVRAGRARGDVQKGRKLADEHASDGDAAARTLVLAREEGAEVGEAAEAGAEAAVVRERAALAVRRARRAHEHDAGVARARGTARAWHGRVMVVGGRNRVSVRKYESPAGIAEPVHLLPSPSLPLLAIDSNNLHTLLLFSIAYYDASPAGRDLEDDC